MCEKCFDNEITAFGSSEEFASFDTELKQQLHSENGLFYMRRSREFSLYEYDIYGCKNCGNTWCLNVPNPTTIGFLLLEKNCQVLISNAKKTDSLWKTGIGIFLVIVMLVCIVVLLNQLP